MNIFDLPLDLTHEVISVLHKNKNIRIERIVSDHHTTDWYDQSEDEWVCLIRGEADIMFEDTIKTLYEGDTIFIPKHKKHKVIRTTKCVWLCIFIGEKHET